MTLLTLWNTAANVLRQKTYLHVHGLLRSMESYPHLVDVALARRKGQLAWYASLIGAEQRAAYFSEFVLEEPTLAIFVESCQIALLCFAFWHWKEFEVHS